MNGQYTSTSRKQSNKQTCSTKTRDIVFIIVFKIAQISTIKASTTSLYRYQLVFIR